MVTWNYIGLKRGALKRILKVYPEYADNITSSFNYDSNLNFSENIRKIELDLRKKTGNLASEIVFNFLSEIKKINENKYGSESFFKIHQLERNKGKLLAWKTQFLMLLKKAGVKKSDFILNVGINDGLEMADLEYGFIGLDLSRKAVNRARKNFPGRSFLVGDANHLPFQQNQFDAYISLRTFSIAGVLIDQAIREADRVLKPRGKIIISIPSSFNADLIKEGVINKKSLSLEGKKLDKEIAKRFGSLRYYRIKSEDFIIGKKL